MKSFERFRAGFAARDEAFVRDWAGRLDPQWWFLLVAIASVGVFGLGLIFWPDLRAALEIARNGPIDELVTLLICVVPWVSLGIWSGRRRQTMLRRVREGVLLDGIATDRTMNLEFWKTQLGLHDTTVVCMHGDTELVFELVRSTWTRDLTVLYRPGDRDALVFEQGMGIVSMRARRVMP